jgi:hypothetical protein
VRPGRRSGVAGAKLISEPLAYACTNTRLSAASERHVAILPNTAAAGIPYGEPTAGTRPRYTDTHERAGFFATGR